MDQYRRRPPMEGFSRPGQLGGEAFDDDEVEGHTMTLRKNSDDDTEGHGGVYRKATDDDDTEGHGGVYRKATDDDDDTEGHASLRNLR